MRLPWTPRNLRVWCTRGPAVRPDLSSLALGLSKGRYHEGLDLTVYCPRSIATKILERISFGPFLGPLLRAARILAVPLSVLAAGCVDAALAKDYRPVRKDHRSLRCRRTGRRLCAILAQRLQEALGQPFASISPGAGWSRHRRGARAYVRVHALLCRPAHRDRVADAGHRSRSHATSCRSRRSTTRTS